MTPTGWAAFPGGEEPDYNMGIGLLAYIWTLTGISAVALGLRLFTVYHVLNRVRAADYVMVASFIFNVAAGAAMTKACQWGLGRHIYYLSPEQIMNVLKYTILLSGPMMLSVMLGRVSFCFFLLSTVGTENLIRVLLWTALISQVLVNICYIVVQYSSCGSHITALWDNTVHAKCVPYNTMIDYLYYNSAWNAFTDLFLTVLPAVLLKGLKIQLRKKIVATILLCVSVFAFVASVTKCIMIKEMANPDGTWMIAKLDFWVMGEGHVVIIVASIPVMNSLVKWGKETITQRGYGSSSQPRTQVTAKQTWTVEHEDIYDSQHARGHKLNELV